MRSELSDADVLDLMNNPVEEIRNKLAAKVARQLKAEVLSPSEREIAFDILREMALDVSIVVRETLSQNLKNARDLPRDVAMTLARDVEAVSLPMLEHSPVFTDTDLVELLKIGTSAKQVAIARRENVSEAVSYAIIELDNSDAVVALMTNDSADLGEGPLTRVVERSSENEEIMTAMTHRKVLPPVIAEKLVTIVSEQLRQHLLVHHDLPADVITDLVLETREQVTVSYLGGNSTPGDTGKLVSELYSHGRLTPSLVLRALCVGDMDFCEHSFSHLAVVPINDARKLIHDRGALGFDAIFERAGMPPVLYPIFRLAIDVYGELAFDFKSGRRDRFCIRMIEHVRDGDTSFNDSDRDYLLRTLSKITEAA